MAMWAFRLELPRPVWHEADLLCPSHDLQRCRLTPLGRLCRQQSALPTATTESVCKGRRPRLPLGFPDRRGNLEESNFISLELYWLFIILENNFSLVIFSLNFKILI